MSNERIQTYEEEIAELRNKHFDTRLDERVATATMFNRLLDELKRCYEKLDEAEYRLEMAEDVLGRSDWNSVYRELIRPPE